MFFLSLFRSWQNELSPLWKKSFRRPHAEKLNESPGLTGATTTFPMIGMICDGWSNWLSSIKYETSFGNLLQTLFSGELLHSCFFFGETVLISASEISGTTKISCTSAIFLNNQMARLVIWFEWRQLASGRSLKFASCRGGWSERSCPWSAWPRITITQWPWIEHPQPSS